MKNLYSILFALMLIISLTGVASADLSIVWQYDPVYEPGFGIYNQISRVKLTPDGNHLIVFHYTHGAIGPLEKLDAVTGIPVWDPATKTVTKGGQKITYNGWVDGSNNLYIMGTYGGYTIWKYDSDFEIEQWASPHLGSGLEYVGNAITDEFDNVYVTGMTGFRSGAGSRLVKLDNAGNIVWSHLSKNTNGKDDYMADIALDSVLNVFRVGADLPNPGVLTTAQGRLIGHSFDDGHEIINYLVNESNSSITGVIIDNSDFLYIAYSYNRYGAPGNRRTVIQKLARNDANSVDIIWERRFDEAGMSTGRDSLVWHTENSFYIAFDLYENGTRYPGLAEISIDNDLLWMETLDEPGWSISGSIDANGDYVYVGLTSTTDNKLTKVLSLSRNSAPVADAGDDQAVIQGDTVMLDGSNSYDANSDPLTYNWSIVFKPGDSLAEIADPTSSITSFTADRPGQYVISLVVNDSFIDSDPDNITIMAVSYQDAAAEELTETINIINDEELLPDDVFKNPKNRNALTNKIKAALDKIDEGLYEEALNKLTKDILAKTDGCAEIGFPDKNDWIRDCDSQNEVYPFIIEVIALLENLI